MLLTQQVQLAAEMPAQSFNWKVFN